MATTASIERVTSQFWFSSSFLKYDKRLAVLRNAAQTMPWAYSRSALVVSHPEQLPLLASDVADKIAPNLATRSKAANIDQACYGNRPLRMCAPAIAQRTLDTSLCT